MSLADTHHAAAQGFGLLFISVIEQHRRQALTHVPFQVVGQHAKKNMRPHPILQSVVDRPDIQIDGLDAAERTLLPVFAVARQSKRTMRTGVSTDSF
jgi:hypothetical protein